MTRIRSMEGRPKYLGNERQEIYEVRHDDLNAQNEESSARRRRRADSEGMGGKGSRWGRNWRCKKELIKKGRSR